ncbi:MAG: sialate O-acetylesterase [Saprospiraceae bacterium]
MRLTFYRFCCVSMLCVFTTLGAFGQLILNEFPTDMQLYGRVGDERIVEVPISGTVTSSAGITSLSAKLLVGTQVIDLVSEQLTFDAGIATFSFTLDLPVSRTNHSIELRDETTDLLLASATSVVAGDVYLVNGQSNALGGYSIESVDRDPFLRGYRPLADPSNPGWTSVTNVPCGAWMGRTGNELTNQLDLPIAIFNFAEGGRKLVNFQPGASSRNFENTFEILTEAGVRDNVTGFLWSQGESDGFNSTIKDYREKLTSLFDHYLDSLNLVDEVYLWQVRAFSCSGVTPNIMEAQRRMNDQHENVTMLSTVNVEGDPDSCHFPYINGREILGNWMADLLLTEQYGISKIGYLSPTLDSARITGPQKITLFYDLKGASELAFTGAPWLDFQAEGTNVRAVDGSVSGNTVDLLFDTAISDAEGVSYYAHVGVALDFVHTNLGLGVVTFYNESLTPGDRAAGSAPDADLRMRSNVSTIAVGEDVEVEIELFNAGSTSLREAEVQIPLLASLSYGNGQATEVTSGVYDESTDTWLVPFVRPGESATLTITYRVLDATQPINVWAEVVHAELSEDDSTPLNGIVGEVHEDDEARVVLGDSSLDCSFSAALISSECTVDSLTYWQIGFASEGLQSGASVTFNFAPGDALNWVSTSNEILSLSYDTLSLRGALPLTISVEQNGDSSCERSFTLTSPDSCRLTPVIIDTVDAANRTLLFSELTFSPNPVKSGSVVEIASNKNILRQRATLYDARGREVYSINLAAQQTELQLPVLAAGMYVLRVGRSIGKVLLY